MSGWSTRGPLIAIAAFGALCAGALADQRPDAPPQAHAAKRCKGVTTSNGGKARNLFATGSCRRARRVARRAARGKRYRALGFSCEPKTPYRSFTGQLFGCTGSVNGSPQGIGFSYYKP